MQNWFDTFVTIQHYCRAYFREGLRIEIGGTAMRSVVTRGRAAILLTTLLTTSCASLKTDTGLDPTVSVAPTEPTAGYISWRLPKTVLDVTATIKLKKCRVGTTGDEQGQIILDLDTTVAVVTRGIPDNYIFERATTFDSATGAPTTVVRDPFVHVAVAALTSFWQDRSLTVKHNADGTLAQIGAQPEDQVSSIVGNVFTSAAKLASVALGVAGGVKPAATDVTCDTTADTITADMKTLRGKLKNPATTAAEAAAYNVALTEDQQKLDAFTLTLTKTFIPGEEQGYTSLNAPDWKIGTLGLDTTTDTQKAATLKKIKDLKWVVGPDDKVMNAVTSNVLIGLFLDFNHASPAAIGLKSGPHMTTVIDRATLFREPAYIPVKIAMGTDPTKKLLFYTVNGAKVDGSDRGVALPFAQFGIPRSLPIKAGIFQKLAWTYNFNQYGEYGDVSFGSSARGVKATSLLQSAATQASQTATEVRTSNAAVSDATAKLQAQATADKAVVDAATYKAQADAIRAKQDPQ